VGARLEKASWHMERRATLREKVEEGTRSLKEMWATFKGYLGRARRGELDERGKRQLIALGVGLAIAVCVCVLVAIPLAKLVSDPANFEQLLHDNYALAVVVYAAINTLHVFIAVIPGEPLELGAGVLFGTLGGLAVVSVGLGIGELGAFMLVRKYGQRVVHLFVSQETLDKLTLFKDERRRNVITFLMMFIPGTPKDIMGYVCGLTEMRVTTWMTIALTARVPSIVISTYCGSKFIEGSYLTSFVTFAISLALSVLGLYYYARINRQAKISAQMDEIGRREWSEAGGRRNDADTYDPATDDPRNASWNATSDGRNDAATYDPSQAPAISLR
jgi:uncharacterized membrane protein YdjX (TVP38/TMEM64 family)